LTGAFQKGRNPLLNGGRNVNLGVAHFYQGGTLGVDVYIPLYSGRTKVVWASGIYSFHYKELKLQRGSLNKRKRKN
jgi:hypothetical protein